MTIAFLSNPSDGADVEVRRRRESGEEARESRKEWIGASGARAGLSLGGGQLRAWVRSPCCRCALGGLAACVAGLRDHLTRVCTDFCAPHRGFRPPLQPVLCVAAPSPRRASLSLVLSSPGPQPTELFSEPDIRKAPYVSCLAPSSSLLQPTNLQLTRQPQPWSRRERTSTIYSLSPSSSHVAMGSLAMSPVIDVGIAAAARVRTARWNLTTIALPHDDTRREPQ
jgi:hypothetical protein